MSEERRMILQMLREGTIGVDEAERLLDALPDEVAPEVKVVHPAIQPKRLLVLVTENGKSKVNIKIPFSLLRIGLKLGKSFGAVGVMSSGDADRDALVMESLQTIDVDEVLQSLDDGEIALPYTLVDVEQEEKNSSVKVILE